MVAFHIFGIPVHRYGIFYLISFIFGYLYLKFILSKFGNLLLPEIKNKETFLEDLFLAAILGVLIGGRLGHIVIYNLNWYIKHPLQTIAIWNGGMSFVGGVIGVSIGLIWIYRKYKLNFKSFLIVSDLILLAVPFGIALGRIGNFLNQELYGKPITQNILQFLGNNLSNFLEKLKIFYVYHNIDDKLRINTNFLESFFEGLIILIILNFLFWKNIKKKTYKPGIITSLFLILYGIFRFIAEFLRNYPQTEFIGPLTKTQWIMILFLVIGGCCFIKIISSN